MIFTNENIELQVEQVLLKYPNLKIIESNEKIIRLYGEILIHRVLHDFTLRRAYLVEVCIPLKDNKLPYVIDAGNVISPTYHHYYTNKQLCLETDSKIRIRFIDGFDLLIWMDEFVEPYFVSYEYYQLYGTFPNGERQHGILGIAETYQDIFHTKDLAETYTVMQYVGSNKYRGHLPCPCGSSLKLRECHGEHLFPYFTDMRLRDILLDDLKTIERELRNAEKNSTKAK